MAWGRLRTWNETVVLRQSDTWRSVEFKNRSKAPGTQKSRDTFSSSYKLTNLPSLLSLKQIMASSESILESRFCFSAIYLHRAFYLSSKTHTTLAGTHIYTQARTHERAHTRKFLIVMLASLRIFLVTLEILPQIRVCTKFNMFVWETNTMS